MNCPFCLKIKNFQEILFCKFLSDIDKLKFIKNMKRSFNEFNEEILVEYLEFIKSNQYLFPNYWNFSDNNFDAKLFKINKNDFHFKNLQNSKGKIIDQLRNQNESEIFRIQNKMLYLKYLNFSEKFDKTESNKFTECVLFHGSPTKNYPNIFSQGFDVGYSKDGAYGYGIYFAEKLETSLTFNKNEVLICKVLLTETDVSNDYCKVIKEDFRIYPMYLVKFR